MRSYSYFPVSYTDFKKIDKKPNEDYFLVSKKYPIFVVADGVTNSHFPTGEYSFPSGAKAAAEIFCRMSIRFLEENFKKSRGIKKLIKKSFDSANQKIFQLNKNEGILERLDYYVYDYFDTLGVLGIISGKKLYYGYIGDCGLAIFDSQNRLRFQTEDEVAKAARYLNKLTKLYHWSEKERQIFWRKNLRNHPSGKYYGTFSGEKSAEKYYRIGEVEFKKGDLVVLYSDGFFEYLKLPEFVEILRKQEKKPLDIFVNQLARRDCKKYGTDRTLIAIACKN